MDSTSACGFTCQICGEFHSGPEMHWHTPENCLRRQLAAANERAGRLEAVVVEIAAMDYSRAGTNGMGYDAVMLCRKALEVPDA